MTPWWWNTSARPEVTELAQKSQIEVWDTSDDLRESWGARSTESLKGLHSHVTNVGAQLAMAFFGERTQRPKSEKLWQHLKIFISFFSANWVVKWCEMFEMIWNAVASAVLSARMPVLHPLLWESPFLTRRTLRCVQYDKSAGLGPCLRPGQRLNQRCVRGKAQVCTNIKSCSIPSV